MNQKQKEYTSLYNKLGSYKKVAEKVGLSRSRVHQVITGYRSGRHDMFVSKDAVCGNCLNNAKHLHHLDFNPHNNNVLNLIPLCISCHHLFHDFGKIPQDIVV